MRLCEGRRYYTLDMVNTFCYLQYYRHVISINSEAFASRFLKDFSLLIEVRRSETSGQKDVGMSITPTQQKTNNENDYVLSNINTALIP